VEVKNPATLTTFYLNEQIDAIVTWGSFAKEVEDSGGHVMITQSECLEALIGRPYYTPLALVSNEMIELRPETSRSLMRALREGIVEVETAKDQAIEFLSGISDESSDTIRTNLDAKFLGEIDQTIQQDLVRYFDYATERGFFQTPIPGDVFYDDWT
jgi:ABC-type nitrate/sulfonate/bicarbonate transport system substrate-binding protein